MSQPKTIHMYDYEDCIEQIVENTTTIVHGRAVILAPKTYARLTMNDCDADNLRAQNKDLAEQLHKAQYKHCVAAEKIKELETKLDIQHKVSNLIAEQRDTYEKELIYCKDRINVQNNKIKQQKDQLDNLTPKVMAHYKPELQTVQVTVEGQSVVVEGPATILHPAGYKELLNKAANYQQPHLTDFNLMGGKVVNIRAGFRTTFGQDSVAMPQEEYDRLEKRANTTTCRMIDFKGSGRSTALLHAGEQVVCRQNVMLVLIEEYDKLKVGQIECNLNLTNRYNQLKDLLTKIHNLTK